MTKGHRLRHLQMGEAWHDGIRMFFCQVYDRLLQLTYATDSGIGHITQPEAYIGSHLVIARAASMQALTCVTNLIGKAFLDIEVYVFQVQQPDKLTLADFLQNSGQTLLYQATSARLIMPWAPSMRACAREP